MSHPSIPRPIAWLAAAVLCAPFTGCSGGEDGEDGTSCSVASNADGSATITCTDGTSVTVPAGQDGGSCALSGNVLTCDDGSTWTIEDGEDGEPGDPGDPGDPGLNAGQTPGLNVSVSTAAPANGTHFVAGERIAVTIAVTDDDGDPLAVSDLSALALYLNGPRRLTEIAAAVDLLATTDSRSASVHHFTDLRTFTGANLVSTPTGWVFTTEPITTEAAGTYTVMVRATAVDYTFDREIALATVQIGTATADPLTAVTCDGCHLGESNGQYYLHHVDPGFSPFGSPELDSEPVQGCYGCHSTDGYAAVRECVDGSVPTRSGSSYICADSTTNWSYKPDSTVRRVHGVHAGARLTAPFSLSDFHDYLELEFPTDLRNCTSCHEDDAWKTKPSREACGSCHDGVNFADGTNHGDGGTQTDDAQCHLCHTSGTTGSKPIAATHAIPPLTPEFTVDMELTPPTTGTAYVDEAPVLSLTVKRGGTPVDPNTIAEGAFDRYRLLVSGPRAHTKPVLTTVAATGSTSSYWYNDIRKRTVSANEDPAVIERTSTALRYQLGSVTGLEPGTYTAFVIAREASADLPSVGMIHFQVGTATPEAFTATNCDDCHGTTRIAAHDEAYPFDVDMCKTCHDYQPNTDRVYTGWNDSQYGFRVGPLARRVHRVHFGHYLSEPEADFEPYIFPQDVRNCTKCHGDDTRWREAPSRIGCLACHDTEPTAAHAALNTVDPTPTAPWSGDEVETCVVCHGPGSVASVEEVHDIADPYVQPYPREPAE